MTSTNESNSRIYSEVWGNIPDLRSLSSNLPAQPSRDGRDDEVPRHNGTRNEQRRGVLRRLASFVKKCLCFRSEGASKPPLGHHGAKGYTQTRPFQPPPTHQTAGVIGEAVGNTSISRLADGASHEQIFREDPSLLPTRGAPPRIPTDIDGTPQVIIGRVVGNFSSGDIGVNDLSGPF
ncbi:hypothetical protein BKA70DRAFT_1220029 [Coprinopsis sp. MPI-PUGE-AT-0042]|nr:hypothetical protein BKA70DRAFT_1220029 [Coprinopsis sp. MPI-PUGE-AT-0042]